MNAIYFSALCLIWGTTWMAIKINLTTFPPFYSAGMRFFLAGLVMLILMKSSGKSFPKSFKEVYPSIVFGFLNGITYGLVYWGEQYIPSGLTSILNASLPFFSIIFAFIFIGEKITVRKIIGSVIGFAGVILLFYESTADFEKVKFGGELAIIVSAAVYALAGVHFKKHSHLEPLMAVTIQMFFSSLVLISAAGLLENTSDIKFSWQSVGAFLYLSLFGSALAFYLYNQLVLRMEISKVSFVSMITPVIATLVGLIFLNEPVHWQMFAGMIIIFAGITVINLKVGGNPTAGRAKIEKAQTQRV